MVSTHRTVYWTLVHGLPRQRERAQLWSDKTSKESFIFWKTALRSVITQNGFIKETFRRAITWGARQTLVKKNHKLNGFNIQVVFARWTRFNEEQMVSLPYKWDPQIWLNQMSKKQSKTSNIFDIWAKLGIWAIHISFIYEYIIAYSVMCLFLQNVNIKFNTFWFIFINLEIQDKRFLKSA